MNSQLLDILCCPTSKVPLRLLRSDELAAVNRALATTQPARAALAAGLVTRDLRTVYRIDDDIPVMLADEALAVADIPDFPKA